MKYNLSTEKEIEDRFWEIPEDLQDAALDPRTDAFLETLGKTVGIKPESVWKLSQLVFNTLLAVDPIKGLAQRISSETGTSPAAAQKIADQINENIFRPVRQSLIQIHEIPPNEQAEIPAVEAHFEHLLESHSPSTIALAPGLVAVDKPVTVQAAPVTHSASIAPTAPKTLAEQKMSRPTSLPPQVSRSSSEPDPYREPID